MIRHPVVFTQNKGNNSYSRLACVHTCTCISIAYLPIDKTDPAVLLWQKVHANDVGSRPPLSDMTMATNQARVAIKMDDSCFLKGWLKKCFFVIFHQYKATVYKKI